MSEFRLGWFCYILQKSEKKKRNQEDFVNTILKRLVSENNTNISFLPEINRVSSNRIFTGEEDVPHLYREALPLSDIDNQSDRVRDILLDINQNETFDYKKVVSLVKSSLTRNPKDAAAVFGEDKLKTLNSINDTEAYISTFFIHLVNLPNALTANYEILRNSRIIQDNFIKFLDNEILLSLFPHRQHFERLLTNPQINQAIYTEFYSADKLSKITTQQNFGIPMLRFLLKDKVEQIPLVQNSLIFQNGTINKRMQDFITLNFKDTQKIMLLCGFCDSIDVVFKMIQQYFPKEANGKIFQIDKMVLSIKTRYDYTADCMKNMINTTNRVTDFLENQQYTTSDNIEMSVGGVENLRSSDMIFVLLIDTKSLKRV